jgi:hypothetical protein
MGRDPMRRVENYEVKLRLGANGPVTESQIRDRVTRYCAVVTGQSWLAEVVKQTLCSAGVVPMMFMSYHNFSRELDKLTRQDYSGGKQEVMMVALADKWTMRGLSRPVLLQIAENVFNIKPPAPASAGPGEKRDTSLISSPVKGWVKTSFH